MIKNANQLLNHLLHCERSAVQAYDAILKFGGRRRQVWPLHEIAENHRQAVGRLTQEIQRQGGEPSDQNDAVVWSTMQRNPQRKIYEDKALLGAMRTGELHESELCRWALGRHGSTVVPREIFGQLLIPMLDGHLAILDQYLKTRRFL